MRTPILDGWTAGIVGSLAMLTLFAAICLAAGAYEFVRETGERVK